MPKSGKIFTLPQHLTLDEIHGSLDGFKITEPYESTEGPGFHIELIKDVTKLRAAPGGLEGIYAYDTVLQHKHRGRILHTPVTTETKFQISDTPQMWLLCLAPKHTANKVAIDLATILYGADPEIRETSIWSRRIEEYLSENDQAKVVLFDNLDIPGIDKDTLYGEELVQTDLFGRFKQSGTFRYIITKSRLTGYTVGIVSDGAVILFNTVEDDEYVSFVEDEIMPMVTF